MRTKNTRTKETQHSNGANLSPLKVLRRAAKLTQQQLADACGIDISYVSRLESGERSINTIKFETVSRMAWALHITAAELIPILRTKPKALKVVPDEEVPNGTVD